MKLWSEMPSWPAAVAGVSFFSTIPFLYLGLIIGMQKTQRFVHRFSFSRSKLATLLQSAAPSMGPLHSSRRRRSHDLGDYAAAPGHKGLRDSSPLSGSGGQQQYPAVRLVSIRTRPTLETDFGAVSLVLQNGAVDGARDLRKLLQDTQPVRRWQERLKRLLCSYIRPNDACHALAFLQRNMDTGIVAVEDPSHSLGYPALFIDVRHKPEVFDIDHWKDIMIALNFEITEPESNHHLDLVEVKVTEQVTLGSLLGFKFLLRCLSNIRPDMLRMLLSLTTEEALKLLAVMQSPPGQSPSQEDMSALYSLYVRYPEQLSALGFSISKQGKKKEWLRQSSDTDMQVALIGLFHTGLETYI